MQVLMQAWSKRNYLPQISRYAVPLSPLCSELSTVLVLNYPEQLLKLFRFRTEGSDFGPGLCPVFILHYYYYYIYIYMHAYIYILIN